MFGALCLCKSSIELREFSWTVRQHGLNDCSFFDKLFTFAHKITVSQYSLRMLINVLRQRAKNIKQKFGGQCVYYKSPGLLRQH